MVNSRKKRQVVGASFRLWVRVPFLICFSPDRLTCPLSSAVVLASYAVQCKSQRAHFSDGQSVLTDAIKEVFGPSCLTESLLLLPRTPVGQA